MKTHDYFGLCPKLGNWEIEKYGSLEVRRYWSLGVRASWSMGVWKYKKWDVCC
jgi:hypothetical protein